MWRPMLLVLAVATSLEAEAATSYRVRFERDGFQQVLIESAKVTVDGANVRAVFSLPDGAPRLFDSVISHDGGETFVAVNDEMRTWYRLDDSPFAAHSRLFGFPAPGAVVRDVKWSIIKRSNADGATGQSSRVGRLSYVMERALHGARVRVRCTAVVETWSMDQATAATWPARIPFRTGSAVVDAEIASSNELVAQLPERIVLTVTRQYDGGTATTEELSMTVDQLELSAGTPEGFFDRPPSYREQPPVIGAPGRSHGIMPVR